MRMYDKPCAPSEPLFWLHQRVLGDTRPGHRVPRGDLLVVTLLRTLEDAVYTWDQAGRP